MAKVEGPDQARSWVIAMAACVINTMLSGISRATGIFYVALIEDYGVSRMEANMPFTMRNCVRNLAGPIVGIIGQRFGVRAVTIIGSLMATLGVLLCSVAPNVLWITVFWGGIHGLGVAFANTLFQVTVNQYFVKHRATAAGIALSGACVGSFVFPIALETFLNTFGLSGAFLVTGGLIMQTLPASTLLREPSWLVPHKSGTMKTEKTKDKPKLETIQENMSTPDMTNGRNEGQRTSVEYPNNKTSSNSVCSNNSQNDDKLGSDRGIQMKPAKSGIDNLSYVGSAVNLRSKAKEDTQDVVILRKQSRTISASEISITVPADGNNLRPNQSLLQCLKKVHSNPMFYLISFSLAAFALLYDPLTTIIVDYIKDKGLDDHVGKYLISVLALGDLVGRLCFGWVTDKDYLSLSKFLLLSHVFQGACIMVFPLLANFETLMGVSVFYGISAGTTIVMFPLLVAKYLANEQSMAIGCIAFFAGITSFAVTPLIGHFRDTVGSYDGMFYITGGISVLAGALWLFEPCLMKFNNDKTQIVTN